MEINVEELEICVDKAIKDNHKKQVTEALRMSSVAKVCNRLIWFAWRKAIPEEDFEARNLRIFDTGHCEEERIIRWLQDAGYKVTDNQKQVILGAGHVVGHIDGIVNGKYLLEIKTMNNTNFNRLVKHGVEKTRPDHINQINLYMYGLDLKKCLYVVKNKNDDRLYYNIIEYDDKTIEETKDKVTKILGSETIPQGISTNPDYFLCKSFKCPAYDVCFNGHLVEQNCRTCKNFYPDFGGVWFCKHYEKVIPFEDQTKECSFYNRVD